MRVYKESLWVRNSPSPIGLAHVDTVVAQHAVDWLARLDSDEPARDTKVKEMAKQPAFVLLTKHRHDLVARRFDRLMRLVLQLGPLRRTTWTTLLLLLGLGALIRLDRVAHRLVGLDDEVGGKLHFARKLIEESRGFDGVAQCVVLDP